VTEIIQNGSHSLTNQLNVGGRLDLTIKGELTSPKQANRAVTFNWPLRFRPQATQCTQTWTANDGFNTLQCALNSCSCLFRFSFIATMERSFWRTLLVKKNEMNYILCFASSSISSLTRRLKPCSFALGKTSLRLRGAWLPICLSRLMVGVLARSECTFFASRACTEILKTNIERSERSLIPSLSH